MKGENTRFLRHVEQVFSRHLSVHTRCLTNMNQECQLHPTPFYSAIFL